MSWQEYPDVPADQLDPHADQLDPGGQARRLAEIHNGQARMAYRLSAEYADRLLYVHGIGWHAWDGRRWAEDRRGLAKRAVLDVLRKALAESLDDKQLRQDVRRCESAAGVNGVLDLAAALRPFAATVADLDADPWLVNLANGTLDLRTLQLRAHDPADRCTKVTDAAYDPARQDRLDAESASVWAQFLDRVLPDPDVRGFVQRLAGIGLYGAVIEHALAIFTGTGANGKSTLTKALGGALGDYATTAEPELFMHRENAHPTGEMDLRGARWVVVSESDQGRSLAAGTMKRLTGGDPIRARRMRQDFVEFLPSHTPILVTNHLPKVRGDDPAVWRRLRVVPFDVVIPPAERNPHLDEELQAARDAVLTWAVEGWRDYRARGLAEPESVLAATDAYQADSDAVRRFVAECCHVSPSAFVSSGDLFERWQQWAAYDGAEHLSAKALGQALDRLGYPSAKAGRGLRVRRGIGLLTEDEADE